MRSFVCGQCHVEYYFKGPGKVVTYPWANGLKVEEIEAYYEREGFTDWVHAETGNKVLKAQHPEFEVWSQGVHAQAGVACADCHMPYERVGALKVSDHWVRSPLLNLNRACQTCHAVSEKELEARVITIQDRHHALLERAARATTDMLDAIVAAKKGGVGESDLQKAAASASEGAMAARLRGRRELHGISRPAGAGADPRGVHRPRAPRPARGGAHDARAGPASVTMSPPTSAKALPERTSPDFSLRRHSDEAIVVVREHGGRCYVRGTARPPPRPPDHA